ncbi:hypothetical protein EMPS_02404 [Entomortierella parvispora]|uniref:Methyltransferase domain-containing protein n=1 Tax=Entomortierella parvispora TaxID=205924 RepID=A0A9P3H4X3_9FUNG|nr:hypothetical protein EMPS_02404 [Entomortierella parvispora]
MSPPPCNQAQPFDNSVAFLTDKDVLAKATGMTMPMSTAILTPVLCHGRVQNPENYVPKAWWKNVFGDSLYLQTDGDVVEDPAITLAEIRLLESHEAIRSIFQETPAEKTRILDLCCGQGRHVLQLASLYPHLEFHGHDQSEYLINLAQSRAVEANVSDRASFTIGDCRSIPHVDNSFNLVMLMGNSFGYFATDNANKNLLKEIRRILRPGGLAVLDIPDGGYLRENFSTRGWEWIDDNMIVCRERQLSKDKKRLISREVVISTTGGVVRDQFYAECLYDLDEVRQLVRECGLILQKQEAKGAEKNNTGKDMSKRGEDLGMMEQRHFVLVSKPRE